MGSVVDEARISLKHDADALDALLELERQIEHIKENIIDLENSSNGFTKADFYEQYDIMQGYLEEASQKSEDIKASLNRNVTVKGKILTFAQGKSATVITKTLAWAPNVLQVGIAGVEEYDKYITLKANMETLKANIYILEILSESAYKESVKNAASSLLSIARAEYVAIEKEVLDILAACGKELKNVLLQVGISKIPVVGFWIDMGMTISNIIIPVSDVTKYAVRVCGDSCMATILAADLKGYLCRDIHQTLTGEKIYVVDSDSINEVVKKYNNLIEMRKFGENDMIVLHENQAEFVKWMLEKFGHNSQEIINDCKATINLLEWLKGYYLDVSF